jgi:hypothetical protein
MNCHFRGDDNTAMQKIADWIVKSADNPAWVKGPLWMHRDGTILRYAQIYSGHKLWHLLDNESQRVQSGNLLIWNNHIKLSNTIKVTHFGPLGKEQGKKLRVDFNDHDDDFFKDICKLLEIQSIKDLDNMTESERKSKAETAKVRIDGKYLALKHELAGMIEEFQATLKTTIKAVFGTLEEGDKVAAMIGVGLAPTALKLMLKEVTVIVTKQIAKEIADDLLYTRRDRFLQQSNDLNELLLKVEKNERAYDVINKAFHEFDFEDDADNLFQAIKYFNSMARNSGHVPAINLELGGFF